MRPIPLFFLFLLFTTGLQAQSLSGNLNTGSIHTALGYGNVDIYRGDELVASVLTDRWGNFHVKLDTGTYRCVVNYDGYETSTRTVRVEADEKMDFVVAEEKGAPKGKPRTNDSKVMMSYAVPMEHTADYGEGVGSSGSSRGYAPAMPPAYGAIRYGVAPGGGVLTAGEVNDFAHWDQWNDLSKDVLSSLRNRWGMAPADRYMLDLQSTQGLPLADVAVVLKRADGTALYRARTDNTGKAELWGTLDAADTTGTGPVRIEVEYAGETYSLDRAWSFANGVNRLVLDVACDQGNAVDVAFVVDATGSMQDEIDFLKAELNDVIYQSKKIGDRLNFRFANVFYRDVGPSEEYTTRTMDFTRVLSTAVNFISEQRADGGGDTPEAVEIALDSAINGLAWSTQARARILFLVLDAGPHLTPEVKQRMRELAAEAAAKGIRIVPVAASGTEKTDEYLMRALALATNGTYTFLTNHSGVGNPHMEPSTGQYEVGSLNDLLVRILKSFTYMPGCDQALPELALGYPDSSVTVHVSQDTATSIPESGPPTTTVSWRYWPNPTTGLVHVITDTVIQELYVTDLGGKVLAIIRDLPADRPVEIDLSAYATGFYLLRYPVGDHWVSGKVVLRR